MGALSGVDILSSRAFYERLRECTTRLKPELTVHELLTP